MTPDDAAGVAQVHSAAWRSAYRSLLPGHYLSGLTVPALTRSWRRRMGRPWEHRWVVDVGGHLWAYATAGPSRGDGAEPGFAGEVYELYVHPQAQGMGMGAALLDRAWRTLEAEGLFWGELWVLRDNHGARTFYEDQGLRQDRGRARRTEVGGVMMPCVCYARPLNAVSPVAAVSR